MASNYDELYHYGILGMHWGVRRFQPYPEGHTGGKEVGQAARKSRSGGSTGSSKTKKKKYVYPAGNVHTMSDEQLRRNVNRMRLEKRYADMSTQKYVAERKEQRALKKASNGLNKVDDKVAKKVLDATAAVPGKLKDTANNDFAKKHMSKDQRKELIDASKKFESKRQKMYDNLDLDKPNKKGEKNPGNRLSNDARAIGKGIKGVNDLTKSAQRINRVDYRNEKMYEATQMSYKELQRKVNRMDMERQYSELLDSAYTTKGKQALEELWPILMATGAIVGGTNTVSRAATGATVAANIKKAKGGG